MKNKDENRGWIKLHRSIQNHWLWDLEEEPFDKRSAFIDLILLANHARREVFFKNEVINVERGQTITSIRKLCEKWQWSNSKVNNFLILLEKDGIIVIEKDTKKTAITICNYDKYQFLEEGVSDAQATDERHPGDAEATEERQASDEQATNKHTNKNLKNLENFKNFDHHHLTGNDSEYKFVELYFEVFGTVMNPFHYKTLENYINLHGFEEEAVCLALEEAGRNGADNFKYVLTVLNYWHKNKAKRFEECKKLIKKMETKKYGSPGKGGAAGGFHRGNSTEEEHPEDESIFNE